jgi:PAS domain S-box-containing protein
MTAESPSTPSLPLPSEVAEQHRLLLDCLVDYALFLLDPQGRVATWNTGAQRLLGYQEQEILGQPAARFFTPEDVREGVSEQELRMAAEQGRASDDRWQVRKDDTRIWVSGVTTALRDEQGNLRGFAKVIRDRTEQRLAAEALQARERRYRALVENAWDGVTLVAADGTILETTPITFRGLGYAPAEYLGRNGFELLHPDDVPAVRELLGRVLQKPAERFTTRYRLRHKDGSWRWVEAVATNLLDEPSVRAIVVNHHDVTEQKEAERQKDEWLAMLAHELRGPLHPVSNAVEVLLLRGAADSELQRAGEMIARQVRHLARIVDDLLDVTRLLRGRIHLRRERLDLARAARVTAEDYRRLLAQAGLTLRVDTAQTPVWVLGDATRLHQVLANLLDNSRKFTDPGGTITVSVRAHPEQRRAVLAVRDTGVGIAAEMLPRLFDVFAQADRSLPRSKGGLGLGLAVVRELVELHGGAIEARSEGPGRGAEFTVRLPLEKEPPALAETPRPVPAGQQRLRILVVEDYQDAAESLKMMLTRLGHEVRVAYTGPDGLRVATAWQPEVVLSDIGLPGLSGYELARELRQNPRTAAARLIAITGYGEEEDRRQATAAGFDHVLTKPADPLALRQLLAPSPAGSA